MSKFKSIILLKKFVVAFTKKDDTDDILYFTRVSTDDLMAATTNYKIAETFSYYGDAEKFLNKLKGNGDISVGRYYSDPLDVKDLNFKILIREETVRTFNDGEFSEALLESVSAKCSESERKFLQEMGILKHD